MESNINHCVSIGEGDKMSANIHPIPGISFTCSQSEKEETKSTVPCEVEIKRDHTILDRTDKVLLKTKIDPLEFCKTEKNELVSSELKPLETDKFLNARNTSFVNKSLEVNLALTSHSRNMTKVEISTEESKTATLDWVVRKLEEIGTNEMQKDSSLTVEVEKHDESGKPEVKFNSFLRQNPIKIIPKSEPSEENYDRFFHKSSVTDRGTRRCAKRCGQLRSSSSSLTVKENHIKKRFACKTCTKTFTLYFHYQKHIQLRACEKYICPYCAKIFLHSTKLKNHIISHTGEKYFTCSHCSNMFTRKDNLMAHIRIYHIEPPVTSQSSNIHLFCCPICNKSLASRSSLYYHKKLHSAVKSFKCDLCIRSYHSKCDLRKHMQYVHLGQKRLNQRSVNALYESEFQQNMRYICNECAKSFTLRQSLNRHLVQHSKIKRFLCDECGRSYTRASVVKLHKEMVHGGKKPKKLQFICEYCAKVLPSRAFLEKHIRTHTVVKHFVCDFCDKKCIGKRTLVQHIKTHLRNYMSQKN